MDSHNTIRFYSHHRDKQLLEKERLAVQKLSNLEGRDIEIKSFIATGSFDECRRSQLLNLKSKENATKETKQVSFEAISPQTPVEICPSTKPHTLFLPQYSLCANQSSKFYIVLPGSIVACLEYR